MCIPCLPCFLSDFLHETVGFNNGSITGSITVGGEILIEPESIYGLCK